MDLVSESEALHCVTFTQLRSYSSDVLLGSHFILFTVFRDLKNFFISLR
jgi:hypothetical protein